MKSAMPYYGVPAPVSGRVFVAVLRDHPVGRPRDVAGDRARALARRDTPRGALRRSGAGRPPALPASTRTRRRSPLYASWSSPARGGTSSTTLASHRVGPILRAHPEQVRPTMRRLGHRRRHVAAPHGDHLPARRQGEHRPRPARRRASSPTSTDREFFIRKAIGWALRQHAWTDPDWVRGYVAAPEDRLSPLSRREALKNVGARERVVTTAAEQWAGRARRVGDRPGRSSPPRPRTRTPSRRSCSGPRRRHSLPRPAAGPRRARHGRRRHGARRGCGAGAASASRSLPRRADRRGRHPATMLDALEAGRRTRVAVTRVEGRWPDVADRVPACDVAVCSHVFYNVPELGPFARRLTGGPADGSSSS